MSVKGFPGKLCRWVASGSLRVEKRFVRKRKNGPAQMDSIGLQQGCFLRMKAFHLRSQRTRMRWDRQGILRPRRHRKRGEALRTIGLFRTRSNPKPVLKQNVQGEKQWE